MNIFYVTFSRFPGERAHAKQIREVCNTLAEHEPVTLVLPKRRTTATPTEFGLDEQVRVVYMPGFDFGRALYLGRLGWYVSVALFVLYSFVYVSWQALRGRRSVVFTREYFCAVLPALVGIRTAWESHRGQWNRMIKLCARLQVKFYVISKGLRSFYLDQGVSNDQLVLVPDGVDLWRYEDLPSRTQARQQLGLSLDEKIIVYSGHLFAWKGVYTLADAAALLPKGFKILFIGGTDTDIAAFAETYKDSKSVVVAGRKDDDVRPLYLCAADVVAIPNTAKNEISVKYTSPLKLFEYMASGTPIVASDLPSIKEVVSDQEAYFAIPDDPHSLAEVIQTAVDNPDAAQARAKQARALVSEYTWEKRAKTVVDTLRS